MTWAIPNEHGMWCSCCGELLSRDPEYDPGDNCPTCGAPDDGEMMAQYFGDNEDDGDCFECGGEGYVSDCFDGLCVNAEDGCDECTRPCPECRRRKRPASAQAPSGSEGEGP